MLPLDNRKESRKEVLIAAFASDLEDRFSVKCMIREVSRGGCRIVSTEIDDLPEIVQVFPEGFDKPLLGRIVWRDKKVAGIEFIDRQELARRRVRQGGTHEPLGFLHRFQIFSLRNESKTRHAWQVSGDAGPNMSAGLSPATTDKLRTPLASLIGSLRLMVNGTLGKLPDMVRSLLGLAYRDAGQLSEAVDELLDAKETGSDKQELSFEVADIVGLVETSVAASQARYRERGVRISIHALVRRGMTRIDPGRMEQVLTDLIANAAKSGAAGASIMVRLERVDGKIRISIGNGGDADATLEPDERVAATLEPDAENSGEAEHGLSVSLGIVKKHASCIAMVSKPGAGTTYWFDLDEIGQAADVAILDDTSADIPNSLLRD